MKTTISLLTLMLAGCATTSPEEQFQRETAQIEAREAYANQKEACESRGGVMIIRTNRGSRLGPPDYRKAGCSSR